MEESRSAVTAALLGNGALAVIKGASAALTGSAAMLAETLHSIADTGDQALLFLGMKRSRRPPDRDHPFGYGKDVYFWTFVVSIMLFTLGGAFSIWEALRHVLHPIEKTPGGWAYGVLAIGFVFESVSFAVALHSLRRAKGGQPLADYWHDNRDPTLLTVLLEDGAALISLLVAAAGLWLSQATGDGLWDAAASAAIGLLLLGVAVVLAIESHSLLIGERAPERVEGAIRSVVRSDPAVVSVAGLHTMHVGPRAILIVLSVVFERALATPEIEAAVRRLQRRLRERLDGLTSDRLIVIEPASPVDAPEQGVR